ncbi:alpha/beta hydrolase [Streptomyces sp. NPDC005907]|uniref:alpha/beta fold hydrolase n=1 Tax=Streptomyces sp. NPDC005907 TaxID=3154571 RepID=UPI00340BB5C3
MRFVRVEGVPHHVRVDGDGPVCVLSAGLGLAWFDWDPVVPLLAPHRTVVRFDRPGLGLSGPARTWPTLTAEARRIARVLDALGFDAPVTVAGHSLAGFHAEAFARLHPARTAGLVLLDAAVEETPGPRRARAARDACTRACGTLLATVGLPRALGPALRSAVVRAGRAAAGDPAPYDLVRSAYSTSRSLHAVLAENATYRDEAVELAALRRRSPLPAAPVTVLAAAAAPGTVLAARSGRWVTRQRALAARLDATFRVTRGPSGHFLMLDRPEDVAAAVLATGPT